MSIAPAESAAPVTRIEIADAVDAVFSAGPATRTDLLAAATAGGARDGLVSVLSRLPDRQYLQLRQLWEDIPDVPIGL